jgi:GNAT superfamily N-acetyltransferase
MFAHAALAARIEHAEARLTAALATGVLSPPPRIRDVGNGVSVLTRPGSPINKIVGLGFDGVVEDATLAAIEASWRERGEAMRVELSTLAEPGLAEKLTARGYRLTGFENVLGLPLVHHAPAPPSGISVEVTSSSTERDWKETVITGFLHPDGTGVTADEVSREALESVMDDFHRAAGLTRCVARLGGQPAGAATLRLDAGVALLCGTATLPQFRRRGVHRAMVEARLELAKAAGCDIAVLTAAPGSQSHANAHKQGFSLLYARAVLVRSWS